MSKARSLPLKWSPVMVYTGVGSKNAGKHQTRLVLKNTPAYYGINLIKAVKSFMIQGLELYLFRSPN
jgi:hypothetical protein